MPSRAIDFESETPVGPLETRLVDPEAAHFEGDVATGAAEERRQRRGRLGARGRRGLEPSAQLVVVSGLLQRITEADQRGGQFIQQILGGLGIRTDLKRAHVGHLAIGRRLDDFRIVLERSDPQQPVEVGRLLMRRDAQPLVVRIEALFHGDGSCQDSRPGRSIGKRVRAMETQRRRSTIGGAGRCAARRVVPRHTREVRHASRVPSRWLTRALRRRSRSPGTAESCHRQCAPVAQ